MRGRPRLVCLQAGYRCYGKNMKNMFLCNLVHLIKWVENGDPGGPRQPADRTLARVAGGRRGGNAAPGRHGRGASGPGSKAVADPCTSVMSRVGAARAAAAV